MTMTFLVVTLEQIHLCGLLYPSPFSCDLSFTPTCIPLYHMGPFTPWYGTLLTLPRSGGSGLGGGVCRLWKKHGQKLMLLTVNTCTVNAEIDLILLTFDLDLWPWESNWRQPVGLSAAKRTQFNLVLSSVLCYATPRYRPTLGFHVASTIREWHVQMEWRAA